MGREAAWKLIGAGAERTAELNVTRKKKRLRTYGSSEHSDLHSLLESSPSILSVFCRLEAGVTRGTRKTRGLVNHEQARRPDDFSGRIISFRKRRNRAR